MIEKKNKSSRARGKRGEVRIEGGVKDECFSENSGPDFLPDREAQLLAVTV